MHFLDHSMRKRFCPGIRGPLIILLIEAILPGVHDCVLAFCYIWQRNFLNRDLKIVVYGKRLTSDTLFAIKTKSLTVKCFTYRIYLKYRKLRIQTLCLTTETWRLIQSDFLLT